MQKGGFWFDGYEALGKRFRATLANPEARSTVLKINSPGGVCAGCFEAVRQAALAAEQYR
ncbi:MAG: hypothetical protein JST00_31660 [Deltaproteobacteria bacterium]|nr:hypothetical protein [Deltaproteobacteria bacterium]